MPKVFCYASISRLLIKHKKNMKCFISNLVPYSDQRYTTIFKSFEGVHGVVRKSRVVSYFFVFCIFKSFFNSFEGVHELPPFLPTSPPPGPLCASMTRIQMQDSSTRVRGGAYGGLGVEPIAFSCSSHFLPSDI
jgi:hypothetical protein